MDDKKGDNKICDVKMNVNIKQEMFSIVINLITPRTMSKNNIKFMNENYTIRV